MTSLVQHKTNETTANQNTVAITVTSTGAGALIVVGAGNNGGMTVTSVTDDKSNAYAQVNGAQSDRDGGGGGKGDIWRCLSATAGVTQVTITFSATTTSEKTGWVMEVSGLVNPVDDVAGVVNAGNTGTTDTGPSITTTGSDGFAMGIIVTGGAITANPHAGNEFSAGGDIGATSGWAACSLISTSAAAHQPVWDDSAGQLFCSSVASWKAGTNAAFSLPTSDHPGTSPGFGGSGSGRFVVSNWWPYSTSVSATVALTGASATFSAGTLGVQHTNTLTGVSSTFTPGTLGVSHSQALTGQQATFTPGIVSSALSISLIGASATFGPGTVTPVTGIFAALTGAAAAFTAGILTPSGGDVPIVASPSITTIGGVDRWNIQIPRIPEPKRVIFRRNMEQRDREDTDDIVKIIRRLS